MSIYEIAACTTVEASPEEVWAVLDDIRGWPEWMPETQNLRIDTITPGVPRLGYRFRVSGRVVYANMEVVGFSPVERSIKFRLNMPPLGGAICCRLVRLDRKTCRLERVDRLFLPGPVVKFLNKTQRARFERIAGDFMVGIRSAIQQRKGYDRRKKR